MEVLIVIVGVAALCAGVYGLAILLTDKEDR